MEEKNNVNIDSKKETLKFVVVGHVDHGKSTLIGRLLYDTKSLPEGAIDKVKRIAKETGKPFEYAYLLDAFEEEQKQGITIDTTQIQFFTDKREYVIIDAPGHKEFLKNMISGAADAEAALLIVDAKQGVQEQSKRHAYMLSLLGIKKIYVVINKMDLVDYSEEVFNKVKNDMGEFLNALGIKPLKYIPVSAFNGENISTRSDKMNWFKGESILEAIDLIEKQAGREDKPLRFPIQDVYKFDDRRIIAGRIETGSLKVGDTITIYPENKTTTVKSIEYWAPRDKKEAVYAGESVGITVTDEFFNKRGEIIAHKESAPVVSNRFKASVFWMGKNDLEKNKKYKLKITTQEIEGEVEEILKTVDASNLDNNGKADKLHLNDVAEVIIKTKEDVVFDCFNESSITGRFVIVDGYDVAGGGIITGNEGVQSNRNTNVFSFGDISARGDIFDEFYYDVDKYGIAKSAVNDTEYTVGDEIPLESRAFKYPDYFDILILRDRVAVKVRNKVIAEIVKLADYDYEGYPAANGRGFGLNINSSEDLKEMIEGYRELNLEDSKANIEFSNKWFDFARYRKLMFDAEHIS